MVNKLIKENARHKKLKNLAIVAVNLLLIAVCVLVALIYTDKLYKDKRAREEEAFCTTIESMKSVSETYLETEKGYVKNWAEYIKNQHMTVDEAIEYIRQSNSQKDRYAHIVDMDTFEAHSTYIRNGDDSVDCYKSMYERNAEYDKIFIDKMKKIFSGNDGLNILGKYRVGESQLTVISVGTDVTLLDDKGKEKKYLLLRVIPIESMRKIWVFPIEYSKGQIGLITRNGDYVIQSSGMKAQNFMEFIRTYNYEDNYNGIDDFKEKLAVSKSGVAQYYNSKKEKCYWYYSQFGSDKEIYILGYIPDDYFNNQSDDWKVIAVICVIIFIIIAIDGIYILSINHRLKKTLAVAEQASKAKTRFLSSMSHDIRTPMNAIIGMTNIAKKHTHEPNYLMGCLDKVTIASNHLLTLINDILDVSKIESGKMILSKNTFNVEKLFSSLYTICASKIEEKDLHYNANINNLMYNNLIGDELRLEQIYMNLMSNAIKYTNAGGSINVNVYQKVVLDRNDLVELVYEIEDTGIGMTKEFQKTMYETFSRESDSRIDKIQGSGLGLSIVKQLTELMGGTLVCLSTPGKGTKFTVSIMLEVAYNYALHISAEDNKEDNNENNNDDTSKTGEFEGMHILVAEDNELNWEIINELLGEYDVVCERAVNGVECVEKMNNANNGDYGMILMDIQMPVMNGLEATQKIRQSQTEYVRDIPIYAMSADAFADDIHACFEAGMDGHIAKPVDMKKVRNALRNVQRYRRHSSLTHDRISGLEERRR